MICGSRIEQEWNERCFINDRKIIKYCIIEEILSEIRKCINYIYNNYIYKMYATLWRDTHISF